MSFHVAEVVLADPQAAPSLVWDEVVRLETAEDLATLGYTDLVTPDTALNATRYADRRLSDKVLLLAVLGEDPGGERGPYGFRALPSTGDAGIEPGSVAGRILVLLNTLDNTHMAGADDVLVDPAHRRQGMGSALEQGLLDVARRAGRDTLLLWAMVTGALTDSPDGSIADPTGDIRVRTDDAGVAFALARGYSFAQAERHSVQPLPVPDEVLRPALDTSRAEAGGYEIVSYAGPTPERYVDQIARLYEGMSTDTPLGEVDWQPETWDAAKVRETDKRLMRGRDVFTTVARHVASDTVVAFTQLLGPQAQPEVVHQENTIVLAGHRGHGLGLLIKARNCAFISAERPTSRRVHTWNADENDHMLAINTALGYRRESIAAAWQKKI